MPGFGSGARELRDIARDLAHAGSPKGLRLDLRRKITAAVQPMKRQVQANARAIPASGSGGATGLRGRLARATRLNIRVMGTTTRVRLMVDGKKMPASQQKLPVYMEGGDGARSASWRHPVFGDPEVWVRQPSHPYFAPAIPPHMPGVQAAVLRAVDDTARQLTKG